jgi:hypothetical protein
MVKTLDKVEAFRSSHAIADAQTTLTTKLVPMLAKIKTKGALHIDDLVIQRR